MFHHRAPVAPAMYLGDERKNSSNAPDFEPFRNCLLPS
jgi:hypothetical protein